jgi:hypothetical protein
MPLRTDVENLALRVATEAKSLRTLLNGNMLDNSSLITTAKSNLVAAINEVASSAGSAAGIDDATTSTSSTWSSQKTLDEITDAVNALVNGAPGALDTLDELAAALGDDGNYAATVTTALNARVRTDTAAQGLTTTQQGTARTNIAAASAADVGDLTGFDPVATFEAGLA